MKSFIIILFALSSQLFAGVPPGDPSNPCCITIDSNRFCGIIGPSGLKACLDDIIRRYENNRCMSMWAQGDVGCAGGARDRSANIFGN